MNGTTNNNTNKALGKTEAKKVNKTWEAFGKWQGAFTIVDPKFLL